MNTCGRVLENVTILRGFRRPGRRHVIKWTKPRLITDVCSACSQLCNLKPLHHTFLRCCDKNGWFFPDHVLSPQNHRRSWEQSQAWFWPKVCYRGSILHSLTSTHLSSLFFFCLWREEALRTSRKVEPQMEGVWVLKWHVKGSHTKNSLWMWIGNALSLWWSVIENKLTWLIWIYFLYMMKTNKDTCCSYCKNQKKCSFVQEITWEAAPVLLLFILDSACWLQIHWHSTIHPSTHGEYLGFTTFLLFH